MNIFTDKTVCIGWQDYYLKGIGWVFNFVLKEARDWFWRKEGGLSFQDEGPPTEIVWYNCTL